MTKITTTDELKSAILQLENRREIQGQLLKEQFDTVYKGLKPSNLIGHALKEALSSHEVQTDAIKLGGDLAASFLSRKIAKIFKEGPLQELMSGVLFSGISSIISLNSETIRTFGSNILKNFFKEEEED